MKRLIALDLDGTLARLRREPSAVRIPARRLALLRALNKDGARVCVVSGRPLAFLRRMMAGTGAALAGEHGWSIRGIGRAWDHPALDRRRREARALAVRAGSVCAVWPGARVERKEAAVAVHYRRSPKAVREPEALRRALAALTPRGWRLAAGKRVWEFRPADRWGKADAIRLAARRLRAETLFAGDDATDEEAFRALKDGARTIKVGPGPTSARERVSGPPALEKLLRALYASRRLAVAKPPKTRL